MCVRARLPLLLCSLALLQSASLLRIRGALNDQFNQNALCVDSFRTYTTIMCKTIKNHRLCKTFTLRFVWLAQFFVVSLFAYALSVLFLRWCISHEQVFMHESLRGWPYMFARQMPVNFNMDCITPTQTRSIQTSNSFKWSSTIFFLSSDFVCLQMQAVQLQRTHVILNVLGHRWAMPHITRTIWLDRRADWKSQKKKFLTASLTAHGNGEQTKRRIENFYFQVC